MRGGGGLEVGDRGYEGLRCAGRELKHRLFRNKTFPDPELEQTNKINVRRVFKVNCFVYLDKWKEENM